MSQEKPVQKKALKKRAEDQSATYKESLAPDFQFIMSLVMFGAERVNELGEVDVHDLLYVNDDHFTPSQREMIKNFQRYVVLDRYGEEGVVNVERVDQMH